MINRKYEYIGGEWYSNIGDEGKGCVYIDYVLVVYFIKIV